MARRALDSVSGFLTVMAGMAVLFGGLFVVVLGVLYGPLMFLGAVGTVLGLLALYVNRTVGKSLQFGNYSISRQLIAQVVGLTIAAAFFLILVVFSRLL